jgi:glycosyltransferase involved in cell wall biosynthesis
MQPTKPALSIALAVYNEEGTLGDCLVSIREIANEIIIVDGSSSDNTVKIAAEYGARVITEPNRTNFHINKQIAIDACVNPWILQLDADERVSSMLAKEISRVISLDPTTQPAAFQLNRRNYFLGRWMNKGGMYPDPVIRLFQKGKAKLPQKNVHELMEVDGMTGQLVEDLLHIADPNFSRYLLRSNRYTTLQAEEWLKQGKLQLDTPTILNYMLVKPIVRFLEIYLRHKGFQDGFPGFVFAYYSGLHLRSSYIKYWEFSKTATKPSIAKDWN